MRSLMAFGLAALVNVCIFAAPGYSAVYTYSAAGGNIPDMGTRYVEFNVTAPGTVDAVSVTLYGLSHTYMGDLEIRLHAPTYAHDLLLVYAAGFPNYRDMDFSGNYTFSDAGVDLYNVLESTYQGGNSIVPAGTYLASTSGGYPNYMNTASWTNDQAAGLWTLEIRDTGAGDIGSLVSAELSVTTPVPEPSGLALLSLAGAAILRRQRR